MIVVNKFVTKGTPTVAEMLTFVVYSGQCAKRVFKHAATTMTMDISFQGLFQRPCDLHC